MITVVFSPGPRRSGAPNTWALPEIGSNADWSCDAAAFFTCATVTPFFSEKTAIMWYSTPSFWKLICVQPAFGLPLNL